MLTVGSDLPLEVVLATPWTVLGLAFAGYRECSFAVRTLKPQQRATQLLEFARERVHLFLQLDRWPGAGSPLLALCGQVLL